MAESETVVRRCEHCSLIIVSSITRNLVSFVVQDIGQSSLQLMLSRSLAAGRRALRLHARGAVGTHLADNSSPVVSIPWFKLQLYGFPWVGFAFPFQVQNCVMDGGQGVMSKFCVRDRRSPLSHAMLSILSTPDTIQLQNVNSVCCLVIRECLRI